MKTSSFTKHVTFSLTILLSVDLLVTLATADGMSPAISLETTWKYIPQDSEVIAWFDMERLRKSELLESVLALADARKKGYRESYRKATGVSIEMMAALVIATRLSGEEGAISWLMRLNRPVRIEELMATIEGTPRGSEKKMRASKIGNYEVYTTADPDSDELCLLSDRLVLLTSAGAMRPILTRAKSQPPDFFDKATQQMELSPAIVAAANLVRISKILSPEISRELRVDSASLQVDVGDTVDAKLVLGCRNNDEAEKVLSLVSLMLDSAKSADEAAELGELAKTIKFSGAAKNVVIASTAKSELWNRVIKKMHEMKESKKRLEE